MAEQPTVNRKHKDSLFRFIFNKPEDLLTLYNALNGTEYDEAAHIANEKQWSYNNGLEAGKQQEREQNIQYFIDDYLEEGFAKERIIEKLKKRFQLDDETALRYYQQSKEKGVK